MSFRPSIAYPDTEQPLLGQLEKLFKDWHFCLSNACPEKGRALADEMVLDGFYPHYLRQKRRILFVGRESRDLAGCHYIDVLHDAYRRRKIYNRSINQDKFHYRKLYIAWGLLNGMPEWKDIPYASDIVETFATEQGISFAFMNLSKTTNESDHYASDWEAIERFCQFSTSGRNFLEEQVALLRPQLVITMNLDEKLALLGKLQPLGRSPSVSSWRLRSRDHECLLLDTYHFSAVGGMDDIKTFYQPICEAVRLYENKG